MPPRAARLVHARWARRRSPAWGTIGLSLVVEEAEGKFKVSQNRSPDDRARVASALTDRGRPDDLALARWMRALGVA